MFSLPATLMLTTLAMGMAPEMEDRFEPLRRMTTMTGRQPAQVSRLLRSLRPMATDVALHGAYRGACSGFGDLVNDELIPWLVSNHPRERAAAARCLSDNNEEAIAGRKDLRDYRQDASPRERVEFMSRWLDWWEAQGPTRRSRSH